MTSGLDKPSQADTMKPKLYYGYIIVLISFLILFTHAGQRTSFGVLLKPILEELGSTRSMVSSVFSLSILVNAVVAVPVGRLVDRIGPRPIITVSGILLGAGYLLMTQTTAIWQMYLTYGLLVGAGSALYVPIMSTVVRWFDKRRNTMLGITAVGNSVGVMVLPLLTSYLISIQGWRFSLMVLGIIITSILVISSQFLKKEPEGAGSEAHSAGSRKPTGADTYKTDFSIGKALHTGNMWLFILLYIFLGFSCFTYSVHIVPYATDLGISPTRAATVLTITGVAGIAGRLAWGWIGDRRGVSLVILFGLISRLVAMVLALFTTELWGIYLSAVIFGFSLGANIQGSSWLAHVFGTGAIGTLMGICTIGYTIGSAVGPYIAGYIHDSTGSYQWAFIILILVILAGLVVTKLLPQAKVERHPAGVSE